MLSKQFFIYLAVFVPPFVGIAFAVEALGIASMWSFTLGILFGEIAAFATRWFQDWRDAEQRVEEVSPDV